jgi:hypothetical protein
MLVTQNMKAESAIWLGSHKRPSTLAMSCSRTKGKSVEKDFVLREPPILYVSGISQNKFAKLIRGLRIRNEPHENVDFNNLAFDYTFVEYHALTDSQNGNFALSFGRCAGAALKGADMGTNTEAS